MVMARVENGAGFAALRYSDDGVSIAHPVKRLQLEAIL